MQQLYTAFSYLAMSQLLLTGLFYFFYYRTSRLGLITSLLCVCLIAANWNLPLGSDFPILAYVDGRIAAATPAVLWLFAQALFTDDRKITPIAWFFLIGYQIPRGFVTFPEQLHSFADSTLLAILNPLCLLIAFGLAVHVIVMATREIGSDLLEQRRRFRGPFAAGLGIVMAMLVASILAPEFMSDAGATRFAQVAIGISYLSTFVFFLIVNLLTFRLTPDSRLIVDSSMFDATEKSNQQLQLAESDLELMRELDRRMLQEKLFTQSDLTIGQLAKHLSVQEYKLRVIINRELGYRNFNQFLNFYRINEACPLLEEKSRHRNISIIAQEVGYVSLSTFNQAFKKLKGVTPSEYKALHTIEE